MFEKWSRYVHTDWSAFRSGVQSGIARHYFVPVDFSKEGQNILDIEDELSIAFPKDFREFYRETGFGFLCADDSGKKGHYRVFAPGELLDLYFEPEDEDGEDLYITFRMRAWENLEENHLLAFCTFGDEDSLIYVGVNDGAVYYLSAARKIAESLYDFLALLDEEADYFIK